MTEPGCGDTKAAFAGQCAAGALQGPVSAAWQSPLSLCMAGAIRRKQRMRSSTPRLFKHPAGLLLIARRRAWRVMLSRTIAAARKFREQK